MDEKYKEVSYLDILGDKSRKIEIEKHLENKLNMSLAIPSLNNSYSLCIDYIKDWFLDGFEDEYFKSIYMEYKHIFDDFKSLNYRELLKRNKPSLSIIPRVDQEFDREGLDLYNHGTNLYYNHATSKESFFHDYDSHNHIAMAQDLLKLEFTFRIRVSNLGHAQDLQRFLKMRFREKGTESRLVDMDFHVPEQLINKVAEDAGFEVVEYQVKDPFAFVSYLNSNSNLPFMYKFRSSTNNNQYFIKMTDMYVHIRTNRVSLDEGVREGQMQHNYTVDMEIEVRWPSVKFYAYYSLSKQEYIKAINYDGTYSLYQFSATKAPLKTEKGFQQFLWTDYVQDELIDGPTVIHFDELIGSLREIIDTTKGVYLSPSLFCEFRLYNDCKRIEIDVNWTEFTITTAVPLENLKSFIILYVDLKYYNEQRLAFRENKNERVDSYMKSKTIRSL